jgi:hypothetical protein
LGQALLGRRARHAGQMTMCIPDHPVLTEWQGRVRLKQIPLDTAFCQSLNLQDGARNVPQPVVAVEVIDHQDAVL